MNFKVGMYHLNNDDNYNFQLNRLINWNGGNLEEVKAIAFQIASHEDWKEQLIALGDKEMTEVRTEKAIAYYRMSEFFMHDGDPDKIKYYQWARKLFYEHYAEYFTSGEVEKIEVPYFDHRLPVMYAKSKGPQKGTILFHGGNDSYFEELLFPLLYFVRYGYDVYLFEGPDQESVLREQRLIFTSQWENQ